MKLTTTDGTNLIRTTVANNDDGSESIYYYKLIIANSFCDMPAGMGRTYI